MRERSTRSPRNEDSPSLGWADLPVGKGRTEELPSGRWTLPCAPSEAFWTWSCPAAVTQLLWPLSQRVLETTYTQVKTSTYLLGGAARSFQAGAQEIPSRLLVLPP